MADISDVGIAAFLFHKKIRLMKQKRSAVDVHSALRKLVADATALRRESSASGTLIPFKNNLRTRVAPRYNRPGHSVDSAMPGAFFVLPAR